MLLWGNFMMLSPHSRIKNLFRFMIYVLFNKTYFLKIVFNFLLAVLYLRCTGFSLAVGRGATLQLPGDGPHCGGFSCGARALGARAAAVAAHGLRSCSSWAPEHRFCSCGTPAQLLCSMWNHPRSGNGACVSCTGRFSTTEPPGKPQ